MKKSIQLVLLLLLASLQAGAQFIAEVMEYTPAPGQLINSHPFGNPSDAQSVVGGIGGSLCLGAFGGYVVFRFENPVENDSDNPFGIDFTIFGNAYPGWAEPAVVWVMKDENANGQPDDVWLELAGSDYWFSSSIKNYQATYTNPGASLAADVPWTDNQGQSGFVYANAAHPQSYYPLHDSFPQIHPGQYSLSGTLIKQVPDTSNPGFVLSAQRAFGYADNNARGAAPYNVPDNPYTAEQENSGGDGFDISWAVDEQGNYVDLDKIDFVKVQNAVQANAGWLGEISPEIAGAVDVEPDNSFTGNLYAIVIKDLPKVILSESYQLEVFAFYMGRPMADETILWELSLPGATIDENNQLILTSSGLLQITASLQSNIQISATTSTMVDLSSASTFDFNINNQIALYPNPAKDFIKISGIKKSSLKILDMDGKVVLNIDSVDANNPIDVSGLCPGIYLVQILNNEFINTIKLRKE